MVIRSAESIPNDAVFTNGQQFACVEGGDLCARLQRTDGKVSGQTVKELLQVLKTQGKCQKCGNVPVAGPNGGVLLVDTKMVLGNKP